MKRWCIVVWDGKQEHLLKYFACVKSQGSYITNRSTAITIFLNCYSFLLETHTQFGTTQIKPHCAPTLCSPASDVDMNSAFIRELLKSQTFCCCCFKALWETSLIQMLKTYDRVPVHGFSATETSGHSSASSEQRSTFFPLGFLVR